MYVHCPLHSCQGSGTGSWSCHFLLPGQVSSMLFMPTYSSSYSPLSWLAHPTHLLFVSPRTQTLDVITYTVSCCSLRAQYVQLRDFPDKQSTLQLIVSVCRNRSVSLVFLALRKPPQHTLRSSRSGTSMIVLPPIPSYCSPSTLHSEYGKCAS